MTKEELIAENAILKKQVEEEKKNEEIRKKEFSKVLGAGFIEKNIGFSYNEPEKQIYSWCEIFMEIGKLLVKKRDWTVEGEMEHLSYEMENLKEMFENEIREK